MAKAISLQDYYNRRDAFYDSDPMIRIAAIHRAGARLDRNPCLRQLLQDLLNDKELLIARYAAITLAQSGDGSGLRHLLHAIASAKGHDREELDGCLRNCVRFPFAVLLNERLFVESISAVKDYGYREVLSKALELTSDDFYHKSEQDPSFRDTFLRIICSLDRIDGLRVREGSILDIGWILSAPMGKQPGFLYCPVRQLFLKFQEESVLNRGYLERGRQVLFVAHEASGSDADCVYIFEDVAPCQERLTPEAMTAFARQPGLLPGVVVAKWDSPDRVDVLCANGKSFQERYRAQKAFVSQFVLVEEQTDMGRPQCHFIPGVRLEPAVIRRIVSDFAAFNNLVLAHVTTIHDVTHPKTGHPRCVVKTEKGEDVTTYIPDPREHCSLLMKPCPVCQAAGEVACDACEGRGENSCSGHFRCFKCNGRGRLGDGRECILCSGTGSVTGCGGRGRVNCPACQGDGTIECDRCNGFGDFTVDCRKCGGSGSFRGGECWDCDGSGQKTLQCTICDGDGSLECFYCHGDAQIQCPICRGDGKLSCGRCRNEGKVRCAYCKGNRLVFHAKVDCLRF
ncbi:MAG: hypothetical protein KatS3mg109_0438 [Pirellulaceae bacterium]|nr:MAG: hypothetical protein KatS3mg109_0438 [Pirellulaceae bacterium]